MMTNQDITISNLRLNKESRREYFIATNISAVSFVDTRSSGGTASERSENLHFRIRIPVNAEVQDSRTYISEDKYKLLDDDEAKKHWTLQKGCYIITGNLPEGDSGSEITSEQIRDYLDLFQYDRDIVHVTEYSDNTRRGSDAVKHWRIGGA